jgi:hypothetical protein
MKSICEPKSEEELALVKSLLIGEGRCRKEFDAGGAVA